MSKSNVNGLELSHFNCDVMHETQGKLGAINSQKSFEINRGWYRSHKQETISGKYELTDPEMDKLNDFFFKALRSTKEELALLSIQCEAKVYVKIFGIPIPVTKSLRLDNLQDLSINMENAHKEEVVSDDHFHKLKKFFEFENFNLTRHALTFQHWLPHIVESYNSQFSQFTLVMPQMMSGMKVKLQSFKVDIPEITYKYSGEFAEAERHWIVVLNKTEYDFVDDDNRFKVLLKCENNRGHPCYFTSVYTELKTAFNSDAYDQVKFSVVSP